MNCPSNQWLDSAVFYQIYPQSFCDSNADGIGDIPGIIEKLDYISYLGCNAIWLNPCFSSPFMDAGYDISDYYSLASRYGTNDDLKNLFKEAQNRGIRICLDLVPGHTSIEHPWFKESCKAQPNKYSNWYVWNDSAYSRTDGDYYFICGHSQRDASYMPNYFYHQPALNYGFADIDRDWQLPPEHPDMISLRQEIKKIIRFWLDMGASGFRVDMAPSLIRNDPQSLGITEFWKDVREMLDTEYPHAVLISEWSDPPRAIGAGFHTDFLLFHTIAYHSIFRNECNIYPMPDRTNHYSFFSKQGKGDIRLFLDDYLQYYEQTHGRGHISLVSGNHDLPRLRFGRDYEDMKVVFAFLLTMPGVPFIYYGDEIGMNYIENLPSKEGGYYRTGSRTPMQWSDGCNAGFSSAPADKLYLPIDECPDQPNVNNQMGDKSSLLETVRSLIRTRNENKALRAEGSFTPVYAKQGKYPFVYQRSDGESSCLVALNPSGKQLSVKLDNISSSTKCVPINALNATVRASENNACLEMSGVSYGIFRLE
ncbi:MAG: alpha-amylase family glycosyl hydrolase [Armatimonadota bacterium]